MSSRESQPLHFTGVYGCLEEDELDTEANLSPDIRKETNPAAISRLVTGSDKQREVKENASNELLCCCQPQEETNPAAVSRLVIGSDKTSRKKEREVQNLQK